MVAGDGFGRLQQVGVGRGWWRRWRVAVNIRNVRGWKIGVDENTKSGICFKQGHIWCTEVKQRRTGEKRRRQELNERIIFQKDTKRTRTKKWGQGESHRLWVSSLTRAESRSPAAGTAADVKYHLGAFTAQYLILPVLFLNHKNATFPLQELCTELWVGVWIIRVNFWENRTFFSSSLF